MTTFHLLALVATYEECYFAFGENVSTDLLFIQKKLIRVSFTRRLGENT